MQQGASDIESNQTVCIRRELLAAGNGIGTGDTAAQQAAVIQLIEAESGTRTSLEQAA